MMFDVWRLRHLVLYYLDDNDLVIAQFLNQRARGAAAGRLSREFVINYQYFHVDKFFTMYLC